MQVYTSPSRPSYLKIYHENVHNFKGEIKAQKSKRNQVTRFNTKPKARMASSGGLAGGKVSEIVAVSCDTYVKSNWSVDEGERI